MFACDNNDNDNDILGDVSYQKVFVVSFSVNLIV